MSVSEYSNCISYTTQYPYCPLALRLDSFRGCEHACRYCFSNIFVGKVAGHCKSDYGSFAIPADVDTINKKFMLAGHEQETNDMEVQALNRRMPAHFGGLSDPFQPAEKEHRSTLSLLQILSNYNYPTVLSTKGNLIVEDRYIKEFEKIPIVLQLSISSLDEKITKVLEPFAPTPSERLKSVKILSDMGFYVTIRCEPYYPGLQYQGLLEKVAEAGAKHVSFAPIRVYSKQQEFFREALGNEWLTEYLAKSEGYMGYKRMKKEYVLDYSKKYVDIIQKLGMTVGGAADFDSLLGDSFCCCYPVEKFKGHQNISKYNFYYAARLAKEKGVVTYSDMEKEWHPSGVMSDKAAQSYTKKLPQWQSVHAYFLHQWNMKKSSGMIMPDIEGIYHDGFDENNNAIFIYKKEQLPI